MLEELQEKLDRAKKTEEYARKRTLHKDKYTQADRDEYWMNCAEKTIIAQRELDNYKEEQ